MLNCLLVFVALCGSSEATGNTPAVDIVDYVEVNHYQPYHQHPYLPITQFIFWNINKRTGRPEIADYRGTSSNIRITKLHPPKEVVKGKYANYLLEWHDASVTSTDGQHTMASVFVQDGPRRVYTASIIETNTDYDIEVEHLNNYSDRFRKKLSTPRWKLLSKPVVWEPSTVETYNYYSCGD